MSAVESWLRRVTPELESGVASFVQLDVDELDGTVQESPWDLITAITVHGQAVAMLKEQPWLVSLAVPLTPSDEIASDLPTPSNWRGQVNSSSPPGLYLVAPKLLLSRWPLLEFRAPLNADFGLNPVPRSVLRYTCARSQEDADRGWEWERTIWIDHWPAIQISQPG